MYGKLFMQFLMKEVLTMFTCGGVDLLDVTVRFRLIRNQSHGRMDR